MSLDRAWIAARIPQQGAMCLLEEVVRWDSLQIICRSGTHRRVDHPLRAHGRLGAAVAIEYGAQAAAVHGTLIGSAPSAGRFGVIAGARAVDLLLPRLDELAGDLLVHAQCLHSDAAGALYAFRISEAEADGHTERAALARGRLTLWLDGATAATEAERSR